MDCIKEPTIGQVGIDHDKSLSMNQGLQIKRHPMVWPKNCQAALMKIKFDYL